MLDLQKMGGRVWVKYSEDESYEITYFNDEQVRLEIGRDNSTFSSYLAKQEPKAESGEQTEETEKTDPFVMGFINAIFSTDFKISVAVKAVTGWKGIKNGSEELPCTDKNKQIVFSKFARRLDFIFKNCRDEKLFMGYSLEGDLKNLNPSSPTA